MQKLSAILLLALLSLFFHGRQLSYMQCLLINEFRQGVALCDCQQISYIQPQDADTQKDHAHHQHFSLAEWYIQQPVSTVTTIIHTSGPAPETPYTQGLYYQFHFSILKPPQPVMA